MIRVFGTSQKGHPMDLVAFTKEQFQALDELLTRILQSISQAATQRIG